MGTEQSATGGHTGLSHAGGDTATPASVGPPTVAGWYSYPYHGGELSWYWDGTRWTGNARHGLRETTVGSLRSKIKWVTWGWVLVAAIAVVMIVIIAITGPISSVLPFLIHLGVGVAGFIWSRKQAQKLRDAMPEALR